MSFDSYGVLAKMCVDHAELLDFPADESGNWSAAEVAREIGMPVEVVAVMDATEVRARWKAEQAVRWTLAFGNQCKKRLDSPQQERRRAS